MSARACRFCAAPLQHTFVDLGMSPLSNSYIRPDQLDRMEAFYPLHVFVCGRCFLVQLPEYEKAANIFSDYAYFSSYSDTLLEHSRAYAEMMIRRFGYGADALVAELASNDGYLLQYFQARGVPVLGIEPAGNVAQAAVARGIPSLVRFFGVALARELAGQGQRADLIIGNNVLAHVPDINDFVGGLPLFLKPAGVVTMEFPHVMRLVERNQFDTIYHEHFSYLSLGTVREIFRRHGLEIFDVDEIPTHGGSLRIYARQADNDRLPVTERVVALLATEEAAGMRALAYYSNFDERVQETKRRLLEFLIAARRAGKRVAGYGAPAKASTLLNYCGVRTDLLEYTVDRSPHKAGCYLPGVHLPIHTPDKLQETRPDILLILAWNLKDEVMRQMAHVREWGCRFAVPIPEMKFLDEIGGA